MEALDHLTPFVLGTMHWFAAMAATVVVFWAIRNDWREYWLGFAGLAALAVADIFSALLLAFYTAMLHLCVSRRGWRDARLFIPLTLIVFIFAALKLNASISEEAGSAAFYALTPLGLTYYTFRAMHYLLEGYKHNIGKHSFKTFLAYMFFMPTLSAGPIHRFPAFERDCRRRRWDAKRMSRGLERIAVGYIKLAVALVVLAGYVADQIAMIDASRVSLVAYLTMIETGLQVYVTFSGVADIAIGFALMMGYRIIENFDWPFIRKNISQFWECWHISLSSWCWEYIYTPVTAVTRKPALGAVASMLAIGLAHEISPRYILWGVYFGVTIVIWQMFQHLRAKLPTVENPHARRALDFAAWLLTFHTVMIGFMIVNTDGLSETVTMYRHIFLTGRW